MMMALWPAHCQAKHPNTGIDVKCSNFYTCIYMYIYICLSFLVAYESKMDICVFATGCVHIRSRQPRLARPSLDMPGPTSPHLAWPGGPVASTQLKLSEPTRNLHVDVDICIYICICICMYVCMCVCAHVYTYIYMSFVLLLVTKRLWT